VALIKCNSANYETGRDALGIKIPAPRGGVLKFTATDSVAEEKTNTASCGVLNPKIK
jgi:hypothetical protein